MKITVNQNGSALCVALEGRLDTTTAPQLEQELRPLLHGCDSITYDFAKLDYLSSAGLRVLLVAHRSMAMGGTTRIVNANDLTKEVFRVTGFDGIFTIE